MTLLEIPTFEVELERLIDPEAGEERYELEYESWYRLISTKLDGRTTTFRV
ncbi:hypothetical protein [Natronorubrum bangense]|uniref:hypothetical protein n=1 Tax=Natronorubrum bangense TaxID=61858 RepID=UPI000A8EDC0E|nr:hypothetical protein [Natronorubrum bangense]